MKYIVTEPITLETVTGSVTLPAGKILELSQDQAARLAGKVSRQPDTVTAFCSSYDGHCSVKVTGVYPDDCIKIGCEHYTPETYPPIQTDTPRNACRCCADDADGR